MERLKQLQATGLSAIGTFVTALQAMKSKLTGEHIAPAISVLNTSTPAFLLGLASQRPMSGLCLLFALALLVERGILVIRFPSPGSDKSAQSPEPVNGTVTEATPAST